jgi:hypothetical protein
MEVLLPTIGPKLLRKKIPDFPSSGPMPGERDLNFDFILGILSGKVKESLKEKGCHTDHLPPSKCGMGNAD